MFKYLFKDIYLIYFQVFGFSVKIASSGYRKKIVFHEICSLTDWSWFWRQQCLFYSNEIWNLFFYCVLQLKQAEEMDISFDIKNLMDNRLKYSTYLVGSVIHCEEVKSNRESLENEMKSSTSRRSWRAGCKL